MLGDTLGDTQIHSAAWLTSGSDRGDAPFTYRKTNVMKVLPHILSLLLTATSGLGAQTLSGDAPPAPARPLNLSVSKSLPSVTDAEPVVLPGDLPAVETQPGAPVVPLNLPYGAGFESRQQGGASGNAGAGKGNGGSGGGAGNGRGGRGGSGRGR